MSTKDIVIVIDSLQNRIQKYPQLGNKKDKFYNLLETIKNDYKKQEVPDNLLEVYNSLVKKGKELNNKFSATANAKEIKDAHKCMMFIEWLFEWRNKITRKDKQAAFWIKL